VAQSRFPRPIIRKLESTNLPLQGLAAIRELRQYLDDLESECLLRARQLGASPVDMASALGITRQGVYNKLRSLEPNKTEREPVVIPELETHQRDR
jgi:DNA-binding CsgD family transcriptional regulator